MIFLLWAQDPSHLARDLRVGFERSYRVHVEPDNGAPFDYRLSTKCEPLKKGDKAVPDRRQLSISLGDYRTRANDRTVHTAKLGAGVLPIEATGLPEGLNISGPMGRIWLPLLAWALPANAEAEKEFTFNPMALDSGLSFGGTGVVHKAEHNRIPMDFHGSILRDGKPIGKLEMTIELDAKAWPLKANGTLVSGDGTTEFTLKS